MRHNPTALPAAVRAACAPFASESAAFAADLLNALVGARDEVAPLTEIPGPKGARALRVFEILSDAIADADPTLTSQD